MLAIITGTIRPNGQVKQLVLKNETERLQQYKDALLFTIQSKAFSKIVFCENSGYDMEYFMDLTEEAVKYAVELELLSFAGNSEDVVKYGKGYGEGEIMDYVFANSSLLKGESFFVKMTGRLRVHNIKSIVERLKFERTYFNIPNRTRREFYDTRFYAMPINQYKKRFLKLYLNVQDDMGVYLEHLFTDALINNRVLVYNFPKYPRIIGVSGTSGIAYTYVEWKCKVRDIFSKLNFYRVKK